jgi:hypothetical protein
MGRDAERIEEEIAGAIRPSRPATLSGDYLRQAMDALWMLGSARNLYAVVEETEVPGLASVFEAAASRRRYTLACNVVLFSAFAAEAYVNEFLAAHLSGPDLDAIDRMRTIEKYIIGTRLAYGEQLFFRDREPYPDMKALFKQRNLLVHARPGTGPSSQGLTAVALEGALDPVRLARFLVAVAGAANVLMPRAYGFHERDYLPGRLWYGRQAVYTYGERASTMPAPGTPSEDYLLTQAEAAIPGGPGMKEFEWQVRLREAREAQVQGPAVP